MGMTEEELLEYGKALLVKGRRPGDVRIAFKSRDADVQLKEKVLTELFHVDDKSIESVPIQKRVGSEVLAANSLKLKADYSIRTLYRLPILLLSMGALIMLLSSESVNENGIFGINTCIQAIVLGVLFFIAKAGNKYDFLI
ncbi:MAG: hypothetical protein MK066_07665, partial [Crocinitomicaceae bacterium]|nr:hypothetical protein [Crocinitomicaceae bacterium]